MKLPLSGCAYQRYGGITQRIPPRDRGFERRHTGRRGPHRHRRKAMKYIVFALALLGAAITGANAQDAIPDLKGTWTGKGKSIVFGNNPHHPGPHTAADPPRV